MSKQIDKAIQTAVEDINTAHYQLSEGLVTYGEALNNMACAVDNAITTADICFQQKKDFYKRELELIGKL